MTHDPLTILQVSAEYPPAPGGVGDYTERLSRALHERGHRVVVATGQASDAHEGIPIEPIVGGWGWRTLPALGRLVRRLRPDVVHIQYQTGAYGMHPAINLLPLFLRRTPVVVTMHDLRMPYLFPKAAPVRRWVTRRLLADADAVIVTNPADRDALLGRPLDDPDSFVARSPIAAQVIPIGSNIDVAPPLPYDRTDWRERIGADAASIVVAYFGLVSATKGLLELVQAVAGSRSHVRLLVIGGEAPQPQDRRYLEDVRAAIERLDLGVRVTFTGHCNPVDVSGFFLASDLVALPFADGASYRRGSLLAALAHAVPAISTVPPQPLVPPLLADQHAVLVPPADVPSLTSAIARLADDPASRQRLGMAGQQLARSFGWSSIAAEHEDVYNALVRPLSGD